MELTPEQQQIVETEFDDVLLVNAYAGTGKTSTLVKFCEARRGKKILYMAYNSSMQKEASKKFKHLGASVFVKTMHSLAYAAIGKDYKDRLGNLRALDMLPFCEDVAEKEQYYHAYLLLKLIRDFCNSKYTMVDFVKRLSENGTDWGRENKASISYFLDKLPKVWEQIQTDSTLAYEHDFYLKRYQLSEPKLYFDFILVDEAQDINGCVIDIIMRQRSKKVFIGDTFQSIYKFRGATDSLERLSKLNGAVTLYLTQSFRCPRVVAGVANQYLYLLKAPKPFRGTLIQKDDVPTQTAIIARTNAKLFDYAIEHIDKKLHFVGGINSYNFQDLIDIQNLQWGKSDYIKNGFIKKFYDMDELVDYAEEANEVDLKVKITTVRKYMKHSIRDLVKELQDNSVKDQKDAELILTTGHKSKGLEWDQVEILDDFVNLREELEEEGECIIQKEELNLLYVAITRSKQNLLLGEDYILDQEFLKQYKDSITIV